jgi:putative peptide zinc metalloprotease protein
VARTPARAWSLPAVAGLPLLFGTPVASAVGTGGPTASPPGVRPAAGAHPQTGYPPLASPPGPPPSKADDSVDRRFEKILWWLVLLMLLLALLVTGANLVPGPAWAEMRADQALLRVDRGTAVAVVGGKPLALGRGGSVYLADGDSVTMRDRSTAKLTFRGGSASILCGGTELEVGPLFSTGLRPTSPTADLTLRRGSVLADTASPSAAFRPLALTMESAGSTVRNDGPAWYAVRSGDAIVSTGAVTVDGVPRPTGASPHCGDGAGVDRPTGTPTPPTSSPPNTPFPSETPFPSDTPSPSVSPTPSQTASVPGQPTPSTSRTTTPPPPGRTTPPPRTSSPPPPPTSSAPPPNQPPALGFTRGGNPGGNLAWSYFEDSCPFGEPMTKTFAVSATDPDGGPKPVSVTLNWKGPVSGSTAMRPAAGAAGVFSATIGPYPTTYPGAGGGTIEVWITASDGAGTTRLDAAPVTMLSCVIIG